LGKRSDLSDWFYVPSWQRSLPPVRTEVGAKGGATGQEAFWLVFVDEYGLGAQIVERLEEDSQQVVSVIAGESFAQTDGRAYTIGPRSRGDYDKLIGSLKEGGSCPNRILHLWGVTPGDEPHSGIEFASLDRSLDLGFYSLLFIAQALSMHKAEDSVRICVVTSGVQDVTGDEPLCPQKAMALGPCKVIPQEFLNTTCCNIDLVFPDSGSWKKERIDSLIQECDSDAPDAVVAYRGNHRWVQSVEAVRMNGIRRSASRLRESGVYLITGGLGRIGLELAEYLAKRVGAKLILVGRSVPPRKDEWDDWLATHEEGDEVSGKIRRLMKIEEMGGAVMVASADVADLESMRAVVTQANDQFGTIHGVLHAAASTQEALFDFIQEAREADCEQQFRPKVHGVVVLEELFRGRPLDFFGLFSSLSSLLGGFKFSAYSAANLFLDAFAQQRSRENSVPWISISWDGWQFGEDERDEAHIGSDLVEAALTPAEGVEAFGRVLSMSDAAHVLVSTSDLHGRIDKWVKLESLRASQPSTQVDSPVEHSRPELPNAYEAPRTNIERSIADIWRELLGIDRVGIYDNFFELGGHSLLGTHVISRLRREFRVELPLRGLLDGPTVADLGVAIVQLQAQQTDGDTLAQVLAELEGLSDESVEAALADAEAESAGGDSDA
jgi:NAD(P)-dependent dehydrogenase (short-subunit alcohol dehydrogenase family)/acyl carrier protein